MLKKLVLVVALVCGGAMAQQTAGTVDPSTGNIVYTTVNPPPQGADLFNWSGFVTTYSNGGGFSGGHQPAYNPNTGTFMFGYNQGTVSYTTPVNFALSRAGTGIQVTGLRYSWEYYNQGELKGTLSSNISLTSNIGQTLQSYNYNMPYTTAGWTKYSGTETFNTQYAPSSLGTLNVSFTGKDDKWWAGYYGPQVRAIDVGLTYGVAAPPPIPTEFLRWIPLVNENETFTLTTAGVVRYGAQGVYDYKSFQPGTYECSNHAWGNDPIGGVYKSCSLGSNTAAPTPTVPTAPKIETVVVETAPLTLDPVAGITTLPTTASTVEVITASTAPAASNISPAPPGTVSNVVSAPAAASTLSSSSSTASSAQTTRESTQSGGSNVGLALNIISRNQERDTAGASVAASAVSQAQAAATQAQQEAVSIAASAVVNSTTNNAVSVPGTNSMGSSVRSIAASNTGTTSILSSQTLPGSLVVSATSPQNQNTTSIFNSNAVSQSLSAAQTTSSSVASSVSVLVDNNVAAVSNILMDRTNPINSIIDSRPQLPAVSTPANTGPSVNTRTSDNEAAGSVSIATMAVAPAGYGNYLNFVMRDAAFYTPREVYKNQRNVDNARALRLLTNDIRHRDMVEQQYRR